MPDDAETGAAQRAALIVAQSALVLDALPRAITIVDTRGLIIGWNAVAEHLYGWTREEAMGRSLVELIAAPEVADSAADIQRAVLGGRRWHGRIQVRRREGPALSTQSFFAPLFDADGVVIGAVGAADDASDVSRLEQQASDLTEHLRLALAAGHLGTWRWDRATRMVVWDEQMERLFGLAPGTFEGTFDAWLARLHPDDVDASLAALRRALELGTAYEVEHRVVWPDGSVHWLQARGQILVDDLGATVGSIGCTSDVTDRKLAEANDQRRILEAEEAASRERLQRERLEFLAQMNELALSATDHVDLMRRIAASAVPRLGDWASVHFRPEPSAMPIRQIAHVDPSRQQWAEELAQRYPFDPAGLSGVPAVLRTGETEFVAEIERAELVERVEAERPDQSDELLPIVDELQLTSIITVPLTTKRGVVGAMQFVSAESRRRYDSSDVALAEAAAGRIAEALDNAWLIGQQRAIASTLQAALLPAELPQIPGADIAVRYWAAGAVSEVGGDFYDVFALDERRWAVVIGDVCGTGATAAAVTATARHTIRAAATHGATPGEVVNWVNDAIHAGGSELFCTLAYGVLERLDDGTWELTAVTGGHPLPILVDPERPATMIPVRGALLGVLPTVVVEPVVTSLRSGSTVVLHTDGVNDVRPPHDLADDALLTLVERAVRSSDSADAIAERLGQAIADVLPIPDRDDDMAVVVIRLA